VQNKEYTWLLAHPEVDAQYIGEYLAIAEDSLVAHGRDLKKVLESARQMGKKPYIYKTTSSEKLVVL
jgi:hypothetical protein